MPLHRTLLANTETMNTETRAAIEACIGALADELRARSASDRALEKFVAGIARAEAVSDFHLRRAAPDHPAMSSLDRALANVPPGSALGDAVVSVARRLDWFQVFDSDEIDPRLGRNMISAVLALRREAGAALAVHAGLFLVAPDTDYPLHTHSAAEVYYCVSGRLTLRHGVDGRPFFLRPGEYSVTPSERLHSLKTGDRPVLLIYLWLMGPELENWWWTQEPDGSWERSQWEWQSGGRWVRLGSEPVGPDALKRACGVSEG